MIIVMVIVVWNLGLDSGRMLFTQECDSQSSHFVKWLLIGVKLIAQAQFFSFDSVDIWWA